MCSRFPCRYSRFVSYFNLLFFSNLIGKTQLISTNLTAGSIPVAVASCAFLGTAVGVYDHAGKLAGDRASPETWEERRKRFFKPKPTVDVPSDS